MANLELAVQNCQAELIAVDKGISKKSAMKENNSNNNINAEDSRRDEWSTEAINNLLDVYEAKWNHRNRGNLKGGDWEDVAKRVSARGVGGKSAKSPFQCKNKVASMKQKYRSETLLQGINGSASSRWPFFSRMDVMLRIPAAVGRSPATNGNANAPPRLGGGVQAATAADLKLEAALQSGDSEQEVMRIGGGGGGCDGCDIFSNGQQQQQQHRPECHSNNDNNNEYQHRHDINKMNHPNNSEGNGDNDNQDDASNTLPQIKTVGDSDGTSTPRSKSARLQAVAAAGGIHKASALKQRKYLSKEVAASIRSFADSILKLERAKMEMFKDSERLRAEMEARRVDMELKRTEIIMNTQLEIAKLLSGKTSKKKLKKKNPNNGNSPSTGIGTGTQQEGHVGPSGISSPTRNGVSVNMAGLNCVPCHSFADYVSSHGSHVNQHNGNVVQQTSMPMPMPPPAAASMQGTAYPGPPAHHFVSTAVPVSVVQPIPALQFMPSPASQPKPD